VLQVYKELSVVHFGWKYESLELKAQSIRSSLVQ